jgi:hypothetical protein
MSVIYVTTPKKVRKKLKLEPVKTRNIYRNRVDADKTFAIDIPEDYYRWLELLGKSPRPMRYYWAFCDKVDSLIQQLWDVAPRPFKVIGTRGKRTFLLQPSDHPADIYWTQAVLGLLTTRLGIDALWARGLSDP